MHVLNKYSFQKWTQVQILSRNGHVILLQILQFLKLCTLGKLTLFPWCWGVTQWPCVYPRVLAKLYHSWLHHYSLKVNHKTLCKNIFIHFPFLKCNTFFLDGVGIVIPPLISIEHQMESICREWNIPCCNASNIGVTEILSSIKANRAKLLIASIELISDVTVQKAIQNLKVNYISVDECQVCTTPQLRSYILF